MCVEVFATYICMHTIPMWVPCSTFSMKECPKYQRQHRNRPLRCSCTCKAPVTLTEALQDNSFCDGLSQAQFRSQMNPTQQQQQQPHRGRESYSPESSASSWSAGTRTAPQTPGLSMAMLQHQHQHQHQQQQTQYRNSNGSGW